MLLLLLCRFVGSVLQRFNLIGCLNSNPVTSLDTKLILAFPFERFLSALIVMNILRIYNAAILRYILAL